LRVGAGFKPALLVRHDGQIIGRIYRMRSTGRELWRWTQSGLAQPSARRERRRGRYPRRGKDGIPGGMGASAIGGSGPNMLSLSISAHDPVRTRQVSLFAAKRRKRETCRGGFQTRPLRNPPLHVLRCVRILTVRVCRARAGLKPAPTSIPVRELPYHVFASKVWTLVH